MHDQATLLLHLGHELLGCICEVIGAQEFHPSRGASSGLHRAWQSIVTSLACQKLLTDEDLLVIKKYINLQKLRLGTEHGPGHSVWFSIAQLAPALLRLVDLKISSNDASSYQVLTTLVGTSLQARLERLDISSPDGGSLLQVIGDDDMHALSALKRLKSLNLEYKKLQVSQHVLQAASKQLLGLTELSLMSREDEGEIMSCTPAQMAVFPGSLTNLVSLSLKDDWDEDDVNDALELSEARQRHLKSAISALVKLQWLHTTYPVVDAEAQQQALGALTQLTYLNLEYTPYTSEFAVLSRLPQLQELWLWLWYRLPAAAALGHSCLRTVEAAGFVGMTTDLSASACTITDMTLAYGYNPEEQQTDEVLRYLPRLPQLAHFATTRLAPTGGRYLHLAAFIQRQADLLHSLKLRLASPFEEPVKQTWAGYASAAG